MHQLSAQNMTVNATVQDTTLGIPLRNAVGIAVRVKDSVLVGFQRSDKYGKMQLVLPIDTVEFTVHHPDYGTFTSFLFGSLENNSFEFPALQMPEKSKELEEVVIYANKNPIYYRGDTLVYVADSFKVKENAVVEDLIRKLPGMTIDADGKISNQGKEIGQVLVDGDEFFGSDASIATKNLAAKGVDQVQVYEKDAEDGSDEKIQVLDLKLKEEAKKGYFGKMSLAGGLNQFAAPNTGFYEGELLLNKYNKNQKIAVFGLGSNTPKTDFNGRDAFKFGLNEGWNWDNESDDGYDFDFGSSNSTGVPRSYKAGFYWDQKVWKGGKFRLNYALTEYNVTSKSESLNQYILSDTSYFTQNNQTSVERYTTHNIGLKFTQQLDSLTKLEIESKLALNKTTTDAISLNSFETVERLLTRTTDLSNVSEAKGLSTNSTIRLIRDFKKKNRKLTLRYNAATNDNSSDAVVQTTDLDAQTQGVNYSFNQLKQNSYVSFANTGYANYVEPIFKLKKWKSEFEYEYYANKNEQSKITYDGASGAYDSIVSNLSNNFESNRQQHRAGAFLIYEVPKMRISVGSRFRTINIDNYNVITDTTINQQLNNVLPRVVMTFKFTQSSRLRVQYNTSSTLPTIDQLQPVPDNSNPNSIRIGNADLIPNYTHSMNANYNSWKGLSGFYIYSGFSLTHQKNAFSSSTAFDATGRTVSQTINVPQANYGSLWAGTGFPIPKVKDLKSNVGVNANYSQTESQINGLRNQTQNTSMGGNLSFDYNGDSLNLSLGSSIYYTIPKNSLSTVSNQPFTNYDFTASIDWTLPKRLFIKTDATYTINNGRTNGYNLNYVIWNASFSRSFLKTENLLLGVEAYDILNQNISNNRTVTANIITDQKVNVIRRYFMLKMTLKFNNNHTKEAEDEFW